MKFIKFLNYFFFTSFSIHSFESIDYSKPAGYYFDDKLPKKTIYLSFDDGPTHWTEEILEILQKEKVLASFFICANGNQKENQFKKHKMTLFKIVKNGHILGNHSNHHKNFFYLSNTRIEQELDENQFLLDQELGNLSPKLIYIRTPYGSPWSRLYSTKSRKLVGRIISQRGYLVLWTRFYNSGDSSKWVQGDWYEQNSKINPELPQFKKQVEKLYKNVTKVKNNEGINVLFHDNHYTTVKSLPKIIQFYKTKNYKFKTVKDLIETKYQIHL